MSDVKADFPPLSRGQKAARTRARNKAAREEAEARDLLLDATDSQNAMTLDEWQSIIEGLQTSTEHLTGFFALKSAVMELESETATLRCVWDGTDWRIGIVQ